MENGEWRMRNGLNVKGYELINLQMKKIKILIYAYGNPGRMDDGLGCALVNLLKTWVKYNEIQDIYFDCNYQLNIEDAYNIADKDIVIFVDASLEEIDKFAFTQVDESSNISFTSHEASPGYIYYLCRELFKKNPATYLLHIKGYDWSFKEGISEEARQNLNIALEFIKKKLKNRSKLLEDFNKVEKLKI